MSCLTRDLQQKLVKYLKKHPELHRGQAPVSVRDTLISTGILPSDVTLDQLEQLLSRATCPA